MSSTTTSTKTALGAHHEAVVATEQRPSTARGTPWPRWARYGGAAVVYLGLGVALFWHVWSASPSGVMTCDCTDAGRTVWYLAWLPFALGHGLPILHSTYQFHPGGFNLLADTSVPLIGFLFAPVTVLFGPVVSMNVVSTLVPAATAFSMYWLLLRYVRWAPAAFVGGLAYGFSAWVVVQVAFGWINLACLALLPLMVSVLDDLFIRQRRRPVVMGAVLGLLFAAEFFVSVEMALLVALSMGIAVLLLAAAGALLDRAELGRRWRPAAKGLGAAAVVAAVLLAYPVWLFVAGPSHLSGSVWTTNVPGALGNTIGNLWDGVGHWGSLNSQFLATEAHINGGYGGVAGPAPAYLGWGFLAVLVVGIVLWRTDRRLWFFGSLGAITLALSLQAGPHHWGPWSVLYRLPIMLNVVQYRFAGIFVLCAAVMLAVIVDRTRAAVADRAAVDRTDDEPRPARHASRPDDDRGWRRPVGGAAAVVVAAVALGPVVGALGPNLPLTMRPVTTPRWFVTAATALPPGQVLATYPFPTADSQSSIPWQAIPGMPYQMAGGGGPAGTVARAGRDQPGFRILDAASITSLPPPVLDERNLEHVRTALDDWGVTRVVVAGDQGLKSFQTGRGTAYGVTFFTATLGSSPAWRDGSWVWSDIRHAPAPVPLSPSQTATCLAIPAGSLHPAGAPWSTCVLGATSGV